MHKKLLTSLGCNTLIEVVSLHSENEQVEQVGLLNSDSKMTIIITSFLKNGISLLQSIAKTLNILGFDFSISLTRSKRGGRVLEKCLENLTWDFEIREGKSPLLEFLVADGLSRKWAAVSITESDFLTVQVIVERNLALLLYRTN